MLRIVRTRTLDALRVDQVAAIDTAERLAADIAIRAERTVEQLRAQLEEARTEAARTAGELEALRSQQLLDTEDRAALRLLLVATRKQRQTLDRVFVLFRHGALHSVHASADAAEAAAEAEGAPRHGWTAHTPGAALPAAVEVDWRVQPLPLGGAIA